MMLTRTSLSRFFAGVVLGSGVFCGGCKTFHSTSGASLSRPTEPSPYTAIIDLPVNDARGSQQHWTFSGAPTGEYGLVVRHADAGPMRARTGLDAVRVSVRVVDGQGQCLAEVTGKLLEVSEVTDFGNALLIESPVLRLENNREYTITISATCETGAALALRWRLDSVRTGFVL